MTRVVVLAAGVGRRLGLPDLTPKWLAPVGDRTPASEQLAAIERAGITDVTVLSPPRADAGATIAAMLAERGAHDVELLENPHYADRNNWFSLLLALRAHEGEDLVVLNSDLFAAATWLGQVIGDLIASDAPAALAIDVERPLTEEAMKVTVRDGRIGGIGKVGIDDPGGEYVGASFWTASAAASLAQHLEGYLDDPAAVDNWYEHGIDADVRAGAHYRVVPVPSVDWVEIDDPDDLAAARRLS